MKTGQQLRRNTEEVFRKKVKVIGADCINLLFPDYCPGCDKPLRSAPFPVCPRCAFNLERAGVATVLDSISRLPGAREAFTLMFSLWMFDKAGTVQHIHQGLKYKNRPHYGSSLGKLMGASFLLPLHPQRRPDLIVPVPLHRRRLLERGYNQSELLARGMTSASGIHTSTDVLIRSSYTQTQTGLDNAERLINVMDAFSVRNEDRIKGKHVLLVDDVLTTGATLLSASLPLKNAGAVEISFATLAMARL